MTYGIILSGGVGTRMKSDGCPKQYIEISGKPIILYTLETFQNSKFIDKIIIVAANEWQKQILHWITISHINKFERFALPGENRQESIFNGLKVCMELSSDHYDKVIIHDAVRPLVSEELINRCLTGVNEYDGCIPVLPVTDTIYVSDGGTEITGLLDRNILYAGQAPEAFYLQKYFEINHSTPTEEFEYIKGTSELAFARGLRIRMIPGDERNFKITTPADLTKFKMIVGNN